jgi:prepilin-type N-terminal cleavage/methylation domain-containing protein
MFGWSFLKQEQPKGLTLVEILVAMALMGFVMLSISNFVVKSNVQSSSLSMRLKEASEVHAVIQDIQADLHRGARISANSFNHRLEYTTYDPGSGSSVTKVYGLCYYSAVPASTEATCPVETVANNIPYLKLSSDGGATWGSPYRVSGFNKYKMTGTPKFLYAHTFNGCYDYPDDNSNGVHDAGDTTITQTACGTSPNSSWLVATASRKPEKSSKVILANFAFTTGTGSPEALRSLPSYIFIAVSPGLVSSTLAAVSPGVKDSMLVQSFSTNPAVNPQFPTGFSIRGLAWDKAHEVLLLSSRYSGKIFRTERNGVQVNYPLVIADGNMRPRWLEVEGDGNVLMAGVFNDLSQFAYYRYAINDSGAAVPITGPILYGNNTASRRALAYNPNYPDYVYAPIDAGMQIQELNKYTMVATGNSWSLPAAVSSAAQISGMFIEPVTGNFYVSRNQVYTSGGRNYIDIYKILRSNGASTLEFSIDLTDLGSSATGTNGLFQMAYDPALNRIFLSDEVSNRVFEVIPPKLISPRG